MSIVVPKSVEYVGSCAFGDIDIIYCKVKICQYYEKENTKYG